jgi:hypothetical protein
MEKEKNDNIEYTDKKLDKNSKYVVRWMIFIDIQSVEKFSLKRKFVVEYFIKRISRWRSTLPGAECQKISIIRSWFRGFLYRKDES